MKIVAALAALLAFTAAAPRQFDVVVTGSTPAGIAAAIAAARRGLRVALVTRHRTLGGELTLGMLTQWDVQNAPDGTDLQSDLFHQFYAALPDGFDPAAAAAYFRRQIEEQANIRWFPGTSGLDVYGRHAGNARQVTSLRFNAGGRSADVAGDCFIDATQNADVAVAAGARYDVGEQNQGRDEAMQPATLIFTLAGVDWKRLNPTGGDQAAGYADVLSQYRPLSRRAIVPDANFQLNADGTVMVNAIDILGVDGRNPQALDAARRIAIAESLHLTEFLRSHVDGFQHARVARFAREMYVRETRHVRGLTWINASYVWNGERPYDTVALAAYPLDVHPVRRGDSGGDGWAEVPHVYGIPLRALVTYGFTNLAVVGPSISATHAASGSVRVIPTTIAEGEAAAAACATSVRQHETLARIALSPTLVARVQHDLQLVPLIGSR